MGFAASPDFTRLLVGTYSFGNLAYRFFSEVWDLNTGMLIQTNVLSSESWWMLWDLAISPDGSRFLASVDGQVQVRSLTNGSLLHTIAPADSGQYCVAYSPDGSQVLTAGANVAVWDAATGQKLMTFPDSAYEVAAFSPNGRYTAICTYTRDPLGDEYHGHIAVRSREMSTGTLVRQILHASTVDSVAFSADGTRLLTGCRDGTARLWDLGDPLAMTGPLIIASQPVSGTNNAGTVATFSAEAGGTPPLDYQWWKDDIALSDGGNISGAHADADLEQPPGR
jgi:WD40 repeat protein